MGGGVMRTATKAAAFAGYRSIPGRRVPSLPSAASSSSFHVVTDGEPVTLISSVSTDRPDNVAVVQSSAWAIDDWGLTGGREEEFAVADSAADPLPRLVFGPAPTFEEAKEATSDLKEAIEQVYFSSPATVFDKVSGAEVSGAILPTTKRVVNAFSLLQGSPEAQDVVASLACDKRVWEAVMNNSKVMEFCNKNRSTFPHEESIGENEKPEGLSETVESPNTESSKGSSFFTDFVENFRMKVSEMVSSITDFVKDFMGNWSSSYDPKSRTSSSDDDDNGYYGIGASFMALAVAVILVVLVKRA